MLLIFYPINQNFKRPEKQRHLIYDPVNRMVVNDSEATKLLARTYRGPWIHSDYKEFI